MITDETQEAPDFASDEPKDMPGRATWPSVYLLVVVVSIVYVALLVALQRAYP